MAIRLIPITNSVLVFRKVHQPAAEIEDGRPRWYFNPVEQYDALESGPIAQEFTRGPYEQYYLNRSHDIISIELSDHGLRTREDDSVLSMTNSASDGIVPSPIAGCARLANGSQLYRFTIFPQRVEYTPPPSPPSSSGRSSPPPTYFSYVYDVEHRIYASLMWNEEPGNLYRFLLGSMRSILYAIPADEDKSDSPRILRISRHYDPESYDEDELRNAPPLENDDDPGIRRIPLPENVDLDQVSALAWDESIGRLMLAFRNTTHICVIDLAQTPKHGEPCHHIYVRSEVLTFYINR